MIGAAQSQAPTGDPILRGIDHIGVVVHEIEPEVARWRALGFLVSNPVPLQSTIDGELRPLGQLSAHVIFRNGYVELSAPIPGTGNHLEPYLAAGEGVRILVHAAEDIDRAHAQIARLQPQTPQPRLSSRAVQLPDGVAEAGFRWFPLLQSTLPDVLSAVVAHTTRDIVFHTALFEHPNGLRDIAHLVATGAAGDLRPQDLPPVPGLELYLQHASTAPLVITGFQARGNGVLRNFDF